LVAYWAVIGDIVRSRAIPERDAFQRRLAALLEGTTARYGRTLASRWTLTLGDEFQALFHASADLPQAVEHICHGLGARGVRFGIGHGPLSTKLRARASGMDGPCFHGARAALESAKRQRRLVAVELDGGAAQPVADIWNLALLIVRARTPRQIEIVEAYRAEGHQGRVAERLGITQGTVSRELGRAHFEELQAVQGHVAHLLAAAVGEEPL